MAAVLTSHLDFSEEQAMLLDTATAFFRDKSPTARVRELMLTDTGFDATTWREMTALGWTALAIPEAYGGSGLGLGAAVAIVEPQGRHLGAGPLLSTHLFVQGLLGAGNETLLARYLPTIAEGRVAGVAVFEEDGSWVLEDVSLRVDRSGAVAKLSGIKTFVADGPAADYLLISGTDGSAPGERVLALVERDELPAGAFSRETVIDETRRSYRLTLKNLEVPAERVITGAAAGSALSRIRNAALLLISAEAAGGISGVLSLLIEYLNTREAFGRKIGGYQALKHPSVDILVGLERARSHVYHAATLVDAGADALAALRMAKVEAGDNFVFAGDRAVQFHGGFGFTWECDAQLFLRRALWCQHAWGDAAHHRLHLTSLLLD